MTSRQEEENELELVRSSPRACRADRNDRLAIVDTVEDFLVLSSPGTCGTDSNDLLEFADTFADSIDLLAFADTVEGILPNNQITKYIKSKLDDHTLRSDEIGDENTINTLNTTDNSINTLNFTRNMQDQSLDSDDELEYQYDEEIEVMIAEDPLPYHIEKPEFEELLDDLSIDSFKDEDEVSSEGLNTETATINTTSIDTTPDVKASLKFVSWLGWGAEEYKNSLAASPSLQSSSIDNDDNTHFSKSSEFTKEGEKSISSERDTSSKISGATEEGDGKTTITDTTVTTTDSLDAIEKNESNAGEAWEHRWEEMKAILEKSEAEDVPTEARGHLGDKMKGILAKMALSENVEDVEDVAAAEPREHRFQKIKAILVELETDVKKDGTEAEDIVTTEAGEHRWEEMKAILKTTEETETNQRQNEVEAEEVSDAEAGEHRWEEMKAIIETAEEAETSAKKKGALKKSINRVIRSFRIGKVESIDCKTEEVKDNEDNDVISC